MTLGILSMLVSHGIAWAQGPGLEDPVERAMHFIDKTLEATELYNSNKVQEALAAFQGLAASHADLDEDGYVAIGLADCLAALERDDEARAAYEAAAGSHPDLATTVAQRLTELELAGQITDDLIERLRVDAHAQDSSRSVAAWQLGRALQKRARSLLNEAVSAFRTAADPASQVPSAGAVLNHAAALEELTEDLASLIRQMDGKWPTARRLGMLPASRGKTKAAHTLTARNRCEWVTHVRGGRRTEFQIEQDAKTGQTRITTNGKTVKLSYTQRFLLQRHAEGISAILLEAAGGGAKGGAQAQ